MSLLNIIGEDVLNCIFEFIPQDDGMTFGLLVHVSKEIRRLVNNKPRTLSVSQIVKYPKILKWALSEQRGCPCDRIFNLLIPLSEGRMNMLLWSYKEAGCVFNKDSYWIAVKCDHIKLYRWLVEKQHFDSYSNHATFLAVRYGAMKIFRHRVFVETRSLNLSICAFIASDANQLEMLKYIYSLDPAMVKFNKRFAYRAAYDGNLESLKWFIEERNVGRDEPQITRIAAEKGFLEILKYCHGVILEWHPDTALKAVEFGHLECFQFIIFNRPSLFNLERCMEKAIQHNHQNIIAFLCTDLDEFF